MNHKRNGLLFLFLALSCITPFTHARNPLEVLGLDENATDTDIKKQCRKLQAQFHADKGGDPAKSLEINGACDDLDWRNKDNCKIHEKNINASCDCPLGKMESSTCRRGFTKDSIRCDCPLFDGTMQPQQVDKDDFKTDYDDLRRSYNHTRFDPPFSYSSFYDDLFSDSKPTFEPELIKNYAIPLFSQNITAPIYNIPLQRAMAPPSECPGWWINLTPFVQTNCVKIFAPKLDNFTIKNIEGGFLAGWGYYGTYWYVREVFTFAESKTTTYYASDNFKIDNESKFGLMDCIIGLGLTTNHANGKDWQLGGEGFWGLSRARIKQFKEVDKIHAPLLNYSTTGFGAQANFDYVWSENCSRIDEFSALSRFTYFVSDKVDLQAKLMFETQIGSVQYSPGAFLDLFLSYKHSWGDNLRHQYEVGYNPTIHVMKESLETVKDYAKAILTPFHEYIPPVYNTLYASYRYTRDGKMPISLSIGGTLSLASHISPFGTFFATFAIRI